MSAVPRQLVSNRGRTLLLQHGAPLLIYLVGALYLLARVLPHFRSSIPGAGIALADGWQNTWNMWWTLRALASGQNPFYTDMVFFPAGKTLYLHTMNITNTLLTLPIQMLAGPAAAYNTAVVLGIVLTGYLTYLLALRYVSHRGIACAVGALLTFSPFHLSKVLDGHLSWIALQWIPCLILCLLQALDTGRWRWRVLAGLSLAVAGLTSWYYALFSAIFIGLLVLLRLPSMIRLASWRSQLVTLVAVGAIGGIGMAPQLLPALREYLVGSPLSIYARSSEQADEDSGDDWDRQTASFSADALDWFYPSPLHPLWGDWATQTHHEMHAGWFWTIAPGYGVLLLALYGAWTARRRVGVEIGLVVALVVLMFGPKLRVAGNVFDVTLPFDWLKVLPGMTLGHRPNHLAIFALPLIVVLAGIGMQALLAHGRIGRVGLAVLGALIAVECVVLPFPAIPIGVDAGIARLRGQEGAVLDLPNVKRSSAAMRNQMVHERPIIEGYLARPQPPSQIVSQVPWVRALWRLQGLGKPDIIPAQPDDGYLALQSYNIRTIILRFDDFEEDERTRAERSIAEVLPGLSPSYTSEQIAVYELEQAAFQRPLLFLGEAWGDRENDGDRKWRWIGPMATLRALNPTSAPLPVTLRFEVQSFQEIRPLTVLLDGEPIGTFEIPPAMLQYELPFSLPPGEHSLELQSTAGTEPSPPHRALSLSFSYLELLPIP